MSMNQEWTIRVRTPMGAITQVKVIAESYYFAEQQARAFGEPLGIIENRYV